MLNKKLLSLQDVEALEALENFRRLLEEIKPFLDKKPRFTRRKSREKWEQAK